MSKTQMDETQKALDGIAKSIKEIAKTDEVKDTHAIFRDLTYQQSTKFSEIARTLIIGILGGAWAASLKDGNFSEWNVFLCAALMLACIYLGVDAIHYFVDAEKYKQMCKTISNTYSLKGIDAEQKKISDASNRFFVCKLVILVLATACFIVGFIIRYL